MSRPLRSYMCLMTLLRRRFKEWEEHSGEQNNLLVCYSRGSTNHSRDQLQLYQDIESVE